MADLVPIDDLWIHYSLKVEERKALEALVGRFPYPAREDPQVELARKYLAGADLADTLRFRYLMEIGDIRLINVDVRSYDGLKEIPFEKWHPVRGRRIPQIRLGHPITSRVEVWDGGHRIAWALATGRGSVMVEVSDPIDTAGRHIYGHDCPYQTLVFPNGIVEGIRGLERWEHYRTDDIVGKRIVDLGCNSGVDGIMAVLCGAQGYTGYDRDAKSVLYGRMMARAWEIEDRVEFLIGELEASAVASSDTMFLLSVAQRISLGILVSAVHRSQPKVVYLESHIVGDASSDNLRGLLGCEWELIGLVPQSRSSTKHREIYRGTI